MKRIELKQLHLINFKGVRNLKVDFGAQTDISGANGTGKTTVFDAFTWLLFGKDSADRKTFNIKTLSPDGRPIERLPHEVSAVISVTDDGVQEEVTLQRRYCEKWVKKRGSAAEEFTGHEEERLYNEVPMSVKDWQAKIAALCDEQVFKFITNPLYFSSQKADVQRTMLFRMAGDVDDAQIAEGNPEFADLLANLTGKTMDEYKREIAAKKRRLKAEIDAIPERIDERRRDEPEQRDWAAVEAELAKLGEEYNEKLNTLNAADAAAKKADAERRELYTQRSVLKTRLFAVEAMVRDQAGKEYNERMSMQRQAKNQAEDFGKAAAATKGKISGIKAELDLCAKNRETLIAEWRAINAETLKVSDGEFVCPTCHRRYEVAEIEARMDELTADFNADKARRIAANNAKGKANKARMESLKDELQRAESALLEFTDALESVKSSPEYNAELVAPDYGSALDSNDERRAILDEIAEIEVKVAEPLKLFDQAGKDALAAVSARMDELKAVLADKAVIERNGQRIAELENQLRTQSQELARLEGIEFTMQQFAKAKVEAVEGRINALFKTVRFKLFETQINGGEVETCVATVDGVPYQDLNNAMRINAGLDIINAITAYERVSAPIFVDNAEAVNTLQPVDSQVIRLVVTTDKELSVTSFSKK